MQRIMDAKSFGVRLEHGVCISGAKPELVAAQLESYCDSLFQQIQFSVGSQRYYGWGRTFKGTESWRALHDWWGYTVRVRRRYVRRVEVAKAFDCRS